MTVPEHERMRLSGYVPLTAHGFALPAYGAGSRPNAWYLAIATIEGDHVAQIERFELLEGEEVLPLPNTDIDVCVGDPWQDVFLWDNQVFAGTPARIMDALGTYSEDLTQSAPLSFLDLALAAEASLATSLSGAAQAFLESRLGAVAGSASFRELVLRPGILLELRRHHQRRRGSVDFPALARDFVVREYVPGRFVAELAPGTSFAFGGEPAATELRTSITRFGEILGLPLQATGLDVNGAGVDMTVTEPDPVPALAGLAPQTRSSKGLPLNILVIAADRRAVQVARYLEPPWEVAFGIGSIWGVRRYRTGGADKNDDPMLPIAGGTIHVSDGELPNVPLDQYAVVIWLAGNEMLRDTFALERMLKIAGAVEREKDTLFLIAPAPPAEGPSILSEPSSMARSFLHHCDALIDTTLARSPFWTGPPRRSIDRRMADIVAAVGIITVLDRDMALLLREARGAKRSNVLSFRYGGASSLAIDMALAASELNVAGLRNSRRDGFRMRTSFEMRDRADRVARNASVEILPLEEDFQAFAEAAVMDVLGARALTNLTASGRHVPGDVRYALECPWMAAAIRSRVMPAMVITGEAPSLGALRKGEEVDAAVVRYTDRSTIRRVFEQDSYSPLRRRSLPDEIRLPRLHRDARNRGLATRGVDTRDVVRMPASRWHELLRRQGKSELDRQARLYLAGTDVHQLEREIALPVPAIWNAMNVGDALARLIVEESPVFRSEQPIVGKRTRDLAIAWSRPFGDGRRWVIEDGRIPVELTALEPDEVPAQRLFLIDGDGAVPLLLMSRLFAVWARALLPSSTSWSSRFQVGETFEAFPLPPSFEVVRAEDGSPPQLRLDNRTYSPLADLLEEAGAHLPTKTGYKHGTYERSLRHTSLVQELDALLLADIRLPQRASDLDILERLVEMNHLNA